MTELAHLVGEDAEHLWNSLDSHKLYYKNGIVYGIIGVRFEDNILGVYSRANGEFTVGMLRDIIKFYHTTSVLLVTDQKSAFEHIQKALSRYDFSFYFEEKPMPMMISIHIKEK